MLGNVLSIEQKIVLSFSESLLVDVPYFEYMSSSPEIF